MEEVVPIAFLLEQNTQVFTQFEIKQSEIEISFERSFSKFARLLFSFALVQDLIIGLPDFCNLKFFLFL